MAPDSVNPEAGVNPERTADGSLALGARVAAAEGAERAADGGGTYFLDLYIDMQVVF